MNMPNHTGKVHMASVLDQELLIIEDSWERWFSPRKAIPVGYLVPYDQP